jgi:adenosylcobinamide amidohydrolase
VTVPSLAAPRGRVTCEPPWLVFDLGGAHDTASWALLGGGVGRARRVAWHFVHGKELPPDVDPRQLLAERMAARGMIPVGASPLGESIGLLTARYLDRYLDESASVAGAEARCVATVGLGNAVRAGDPPGPFRVGTINLVCQLAVPLSPPALLEALAVAVEARTAAVLDAAIVSRRSDQLATGTGTDCAVIAAPIASDAAAVAHHAGTHTPLGAAIGQAVYRAIRRGADAWKEEQGVP